MGKFMEFVKDKAEDAMQNMQQGHQEQSHQDQSHFQTPAAFDTDAVVSHAKNDPNDHTDPVDYLNKNQHAAANDPIDESAVEQAHRDAYGQDNKSITADSIGVAAAFQAIKKFTGTGMSGEAAQSPGMMQSVMAEAANLFHERTKHGNVQGSQTDAMQSAAMTFGKMLLQSKGGSSAAMMLLKSQSGGSGGMMSMAKMFFNK